MLFWPRGAISMKPGPKSTPTTILKLRGSQCVKSRKNEVKPASGPATMPKWLLDSSVEVTAIDVWNEIVPQLEELGVMFRIDTNAVARYCDAFALWLKMSAEINSGVAMEFHDDEGNVKYSQQKPHIAIYHKLGDTLSKLEAQFGLTPSARVGLTANKPKSGKNKRDQYFG